MSVFDRAALTVAESNLQRAKAALDMLGRESRPDDRWNELCRQVDPQRVIRNLTQESIVGVDKEASDELDRRYRRTEPNSATIPWETLAYRNQRAMQTRADVVGTLSSGGDSVETVNYPSAAGALLSLLILGRRGATPVNSTANLNLPRISSSANTYWLTTETTGLTESEQAFGQVNFSPHQCGGYTEMSRLLVIQSSPDAADTVAMDLVRKIKRTIEAAAFNGSGDAGQPKGIIGATGVTTASGATATLSTFTTAVGQIGDALDVDSNPGWAVARSVALTLRQRFEVPTYGSIPIWRGPATYGQLIDYDSAASSGVPSATAIFGAWKFLTLVDFGGGLQVSVNPFGSYSGSGYGDAGNFQKGIVGMRCFAVLDVAPVWGSAFTTLTSIS